MFLARVTGSVVSTQKVDAMVGQKLLRDRVEKTFAEFIARVPAAALADSGMKRHYKTPEPRKTLRRLVPADQKDLDALNSSGGR